MAVWLLWAEESKGLGTALAGDFHKKRKKKKAVIMSSIFFFFILRFLFIYFGRSHKMNCPFYLKELGDLNGFKIIIYIYFIIIE